MLPCQRKGPKNVLYGTRKQIKSKKKRIKKVIFLDNKYKNTENNIAARFLFKTAGIETVQYTKSSREVSLSL